MSSWNHGYVTDITYTKGYYATLNPLRIKLCFLAQKLLPPKVQNACELAFGQGVTLNFNAASANANWYGTDFNPSQAAFAQNLANISGAPVKIYDDSFEEFLARDDLPQFDFIALHGIYSWVTPEIRKQIESFIHKKLNVGGACLISYNCQPGWASIAPLRDLLRAYSTYLTPTGKPSSIRAKEGLEFVNELMALPSTEAIKNPQVTSMLQTLQKMDPTYLAHELLNENQIPFNFLEVNKQLENAKLDFASYCNFYDHLSNIQLSDQEREILSKVSHNRAIYEMLKDLIFATSFRSDYWAKGTVHLSDAQCEDELLKLQIVLIVPFSQINYNLQTRRGTLNLNGDFYSPILEFLKDNDPKSVKEIKALLEEKLKRKVKFTEILEALIALSCKDYIKLAQEQECAKQSKAYAQKLNSYIINQALKTPSYINHLLSPITGEAIPLNHFELLSLYAMTNARGKKDQIDLIFNALQDQKENISKDGKPLKDGEIKQELDKQIQNLEIWLPTLQKLQII